MVSIPLPHDAALEARLDGTLGFDAVVVCHPHPAFGGRMDTPLVAALARGFVDAGLAALRFHYRGIEGSTGTATGGLEEHEDVLAAHRWLHEQGAARIAWVGYSFGALMALRALEQARPAAYVGVALPTGIVAAEPARIAQLQRAPARAPTLFLTGSKDPLSDPALMTQWVETKCIEIVAGESHSFTHEGTRRIVSRAVGFVRDALTP